MPKPVLLVDGEVFDPNKPTQALLDIKRFLDKSPKNEVYSMEKLRDLSGRAYSTIRSLLKHPLLSCYFYHHGRNNSLHFGHPEAIKLLKATVQKKLAERGK